MGSNDKVAVYADSAALLTRPPTIYLNNIGEESIEAVRVEVSFIGGTIDYRLDGVARTNPPVPPVDWFKNDTPIILKAADRSDHILSELWRPGQSLAIPLVKEVLSQATQAQSKNRIDRTHYARLDVAVSCRIAGSNYFHRDKSSVSVLVAWKPRGFGDEETKRISTSYEARLRIEDRIRKSIESFSGDQRELNIFEREPNFSRYRPL